MYTIERRKISGGGTVETVYEIRTYERIADNGAFIGGKTVKIAKEKKTAERYLCKKGLRLLGKRDDATEIWAPSKLWGVG